ncbi:hypothetical protein K431DRAFT_285751 [Polychaeton citri CBS 116435]|uniref:Uncharacterized protein n=1 Tax=Polychaeton citri CBS 116435 TaxID=1314669 RepID=A0A9P4UPG9_9PEZI|nr:hypothetical protein K431DRAFT_285751 [Polychaeton citri CBS 116435]
MDLIPKVPNPSNAQSIPVINPRWWPSKASISLSPTPLRPAPSREMQPSIVRPRFTLDSLEFYSGGLRSYAWPSRLASPWIDTYSPAPGAAATVRAKGRPSL